MAQPEGFSGSCVIRALLRSKTLRALAVPRAAGPAAYVAIDGLGFGAPHQRAEELDVGAALRLHAPRRRARAGRAAPPSARSGCAAGWNRTSAPARRNSRRRPGGLPSNQQVPTFSAMWRGDRRPDPDRRGTARNPSARGLAGRERERERGEQRPTRLMRRFSIKPAASPSKSGSPSSAALRGVGQVLRMRHHAEHVAAFVQDAGDVAARAVRDWCPRRSGRRRGLRLPAGRASLVGEIIAVGMGDRAADDLARAVARG